MQYADYSVAVGATRRRCGIVGPQRDYLDPPASLAGETGLRLDPAPGPCSAAAGDAVEFRLGAAIRDWLPWSTSVSLEFMLHGPPSRCWPPPAAAVPIGAPV